jgi:hypothetical protein
MTIHFSLKRCLSALSVILLGLFLSGCAINLPVTATPKLIKENPINKIALLGDASVVWPGSFSRSLGLEASKETLGLGLPVIKEELKTLGYDVSYVQSVAVGFKNTFDKDQWVYPSAGEPKVELDHQTPATTPSTNTTTVDTNSFGDAYQIKDGKPAYVYPKFALGTALGDAARNVFESYDAAADKLSFTVPAENLALLRTETTADTLCLARIGGQRYTAGRKAGAIAMNALTIWFGVVVLPPSDSSFVKLVCFDMAQGAHLWSGVGALGDPEKPVGDLLKHGLGTFPRKGETLSPQCKADPNNAAMITCTPRDANTKNDLVKAIN